MRAVRRRPEDHLKERQHVQMTRPAGFVEGIEEVRRMRGNAERDVPQPDRPAHIKRLVAKENTERRLGVIRGHKPPCHRRDAQEHRNDQQPGHPPPVVRIESRYGVAMNHPHRCREPYRRRRQRVHSAHEDRHHRRGDPRLHATSSENHESYCPAIAGSANRYDASLAAAAIEARRRSSVSTASSACATAAGVCSATMTPSTLSRTISSGPGELVTTTGTPHAIASTSTLPKPS